MDGQRFDDLTRTLTHGASRRRVVRGLLGGVLGALGATLGLRRAGAQGACSAYGRVCTYTGCCTGGAECVCYRNGHCRCLCPAGSSCPAGATFDPATCRCTCTATGQPACGVGAAATCCPAGQDCEDPAAGRCGLALQEACTSADQCDQSGGLTHCDVNEFDDCSGVATCCRPFGGDCETTCDCCGFGICDAGVCD